MKNLTQNDIQLIIKLHQDGSYREVIKKVNIFIKHLPDDIFLLNILGASYEKLNDFLSAQKAYEHAFKINNQIPEIIFNLGAIKFNLKNINGALEDYDKALKLKPDFVEVFFNKGILFQYLGDYDLALENYQKAVNLQPGFYEALNNIGAVYQLQGKLDQAIKIYEKSLAASKQSRTYFNLAGTYRNQGHLKDAIQNLEKAIALENNNPEFLSDIGDAFWHDGNLTEGRKFLLKAVEIEPRHPKANYQLAIYYYDNKELKKAIPHFEISKIHDSEARALYCLYKLKDFDRFFKQLKKTIGKKHTSPLLSTLSLHYSVNFKKEDIYKFCPNPLDYVFHEKIPELIQDDKKLMIELLNEIDRAEISDRKQSRLYNGIQSSGNLFQRKEESFRIISEALKKLIYKFYETHKNKDCAFVKLFPKKIIFSSSWYVRMKQGGHLTSHIHEDGWISGALYLKIPKQRNSANEGAIELSTHGDDYPQVHENFPYKTILPNEGDVIFFPSSVFHRTIPFTSNEERICIAFDLKPSESLSNNNLI
jgi:uncharacterized protein (TIGR02466 family)